MTTRRPATRPDQLEAIEAQLRATRDELAAARDELHAETARRTAIEGELRESRRRFSEITQSIGEVFWLTDWTTHRVIYVSPAYEETWGRSCQSLYDDPRSWTAAIHPDDVDRVVAAFEVDVERDAYDITYRIVSGDDSIRWIQDRAFTIRDDAGRIQRVAGVSRDITAQMDAHVDAELGRRLLNTLMDSMPDSIYFKDRDGWFTNVNRTLIGQFGADDVDEIIGRTDAEFFPIEDARIYADDERRVIETGEPLINRIERCRFSDGRERWYSSHKAAIHDQQGHVTGLVGISRDITDLQETQHALAASESKFRSIFDDAGCAMMITDLDGNVLRCNRILLGLLDFAETEVCGRLVCDFVHEDDRRDAVEILDQLRRRDRVKVETEQRFRRRDGSTIWGRLTCTVARDGAGRPDFLIAILEDVTEHRRATAWLEGQTEVLRRLATGGSLRETLTILVHMIEEQADGMLGSVLILDEAGRHLTCGAAPNLPPAYNDAIDGVEIGPSVGSCGTAAWEGRRVVAEDVQTDPRWANFRHVAAAHELRACWSQPVFGSDRSVLGTFALYYRDPRSPSLAELELIENAAWLAGIAIERRHDEITLRESEERYRVLAETASDGIITVDSDSQIRFANDSAGRIFGYDLEDLIGYPLSMLIPKDLRKAFPPATPGESAAPASTASWKGIEVVGLHRSGRSLPLELSFGEQVIDGEHLVTGFIRDVTDRKRAEVALRQAHDELEKRVVERTAKLAAANAGLEVEVRERRRIQDALRQSEEQLRLVTDALPALISYVDRDGRYRFNNAAYEQWFGIPREKLKDRPVREVLGESAYAAAREEIRTALGGTPISFDTELVTADGRTRTVHVTFTPHVAENGEIPGMFVLAADVTEAMKAAADLRESETRLRMLVAQVPAILWTTDTGLRFVSSVGTGLKSLGLQPDQVNGKDLREFFAEQGEDDGQTLEAHRQALGGASVTYNQRMNDRTFECHVEPLRGGDGSTSGTVGTVGIALDVTDREKTKEQVREYQQRLQSLAADLTLAEERERRRIAADLHDRIGQALGLAQIKLQSIQGLPVAGTSPAVSDCIELISQTIEDARTLMFDLSPPVLYDLGIEAAAAWLVDEFDADDDLNFEFRSDLSSKPLDEVPRVIVFRAIRELLINIRKHARATSAVVSLQREGNRLRVEVTDDGVGFDSSRLLLGDGSQGGFGLFSIREQLDRHGGVMNIDSTPGNGTRIVLSVPLTTEDGAGRGGDS